ncbi:MAG: hypothetical protein OEW15_17570 [Nitrospirota bacterium]|nr:hypothetical protein [Nitrospirota bacterium]
MDNESELLGRLLRDESYLNSTIAAHVVDPNIDEIEKEAARLMALQGKEVPGWKYKYTRRDDITDVEVTRNMFDFSAGYFGGEYAVLVQTMLLMHFQGYLLSLKPLVQYEVCVKLDYCKRMKSAEDKEKDWNALKEFAEWLIKEVLKINFPPLAIVVFLVKRGILDSWCDCRS